MMFAADWMGMSVLAALMPYVVIGEVCLAVSETPFTGVNLHHVNMAAI